jgi:hypothetical protein
MDIGNGFFFISFRSFPICRKKSPTSMALAISSGDCHDAKRPVLKKRELRRGSKLERSLGCSIIENVLKSFANELAWLELRAMPRHKFF